MKFRPVPYMEWMNHPDRNSNYGETGKRQGIINRFHAHSLRRYLLVAGWKLAPIKASISFLSTAGLAGEQGRGAKRWWTLILIKFYDCSEWRQLFHLRLPNKRTSGTRRKADLMHHLAFDWQNLPVLFELFTYGPGAHPCPNGRDWKVFHSVYLLCKQSFPNDRSQPIRSVKPNKAPTKLGRPIPSCPLTVERSENKITE